MALLAMAMLVFNLLVYRGLAAGGWWDSYLALNARASAAVLSMLGYPVGAAGASLTSPQFPMSVATGCDAVQASAFFVFAVLLSPVAAAWRRRVLPIIGGLVFLAAINILRIVSLYLVGVYYVQAFDFVHGEVWQLLFILLPLVLWLGWVRAAMNRAEVGEDVAG